MANRTLTNSASVTWDETTPGQIKANVLASVLPNSIIMPDNADDEQDLFDAYDDLPTVAGGGAIYLPDAPIVLTAKFHLFTKPVRIYGTGPNSALVAEANVAPENMMIQTGGDDAIDGVELAYFKLVNDRVLAPSATRNLGISIQGGSKNINIHHLHGQGITADFVIIRPDYNNWVADNTLDANGITVHHNLVDEWYESFINLREGVIRNVSCFNNIGNVSVGHPNGGISRPYGLSLAIEGSNGLVEDVSFAHNLMVNTMSSKTNSYGMLLAFETFQQVVKYNRISFYDNTLTGWWDATRIWLVRVDNTAIFPGFSHVTYASNHHLLTTSKNMVLGPIGGHVEDHLVLEDNENDVSLGAQGLVITAPGGDPEFQCTVDNINNRNI